MENQGLSQFVKTKRKELGHPIFDIINFFEQVIFCFLTGNNDMHLKNFSLFKNAKGVYNLSPAYDLVAAELVVEGDDDELALTLNGKKKKVNKTDFEIAMSRFNLDRKVLTNIFNRFHIALPKWYKFINISFLPKDVRDRYQEMINQKARQIGLS